jgi:hypothetical protein
METKQMKTKNKKQGRRRRISNFCQKFSCTMSSDEFNEGLAGLLQAGKFLGDAEFINRYGKQRLAGPDSFQVWSTPR